MRWREAILVGVAAGALAGCPLYPVPPYNATGKYQGEWSSYIPILGEEPVGCVLHFDFKQETLLNVYPLNHSVTGKISFDFNCPEVMVLTVLLGLPQQISYDIVIGSMKPDGSLNIVASDNVEGFTSVAVFEAITADEDEDGFMDTLEGTWYFTISTGSIPVLVEGEFTAARLAAP
ncbi:MAG TPA: hypothetical protein PKI11_13215 [Candidatus Hydrogenedentes bacterium]|nr:hypothetical protein [Candidatus Hydrogenedentota bacterium]HNT88629.1 hypothetical protein [Candidatus Hydrogenedentota bacterium]